MRQGPSQHGTPSRPGWPELTELYLTLPPGIKGTSHFNQTIISLDSFNLDWAYPFLGRIVHKGFHVLLIMGDMEQSTISYSLYYLVSKSQYFQCACVLTATYVYLTNWSLFVHFWDCLSCMPTDLNQAHYVIKDDFELLILLSPSPKYWEVYAP